MKVVVRSLLDLPVEIKKINVDVIGGSGYTPSTPTNPLYEAFDIHDMTSFDFVNDLCTQLGASPQQRDTILKYAQAMNSLMTYIRQKLDESVGVASVSSKEGLFWLKMNKYNFTEENIGSRGGQPHTDIGFLTILQDDENVGGLEFMVKSGTYMPVYPCPGTLLVLLGDMATLWSNGRFRSVKHRVMCKEATVRISIASFFCGPKDTVIEAPQELVDSLHPPLYTPITYKDYRELRFSTNLHTGEALALIRSGTREDHENPTF